MRSTDTSEVRRGAGVTGRRGRTIGAMARDMASRPTGNAFTHFFDKVDEALEPIFGAPPITVDDEPMRGPTGEEACPICGRAMFEHSFDRSTSNTVLICPTDERLPEHDVAGPYGELGMPATGRRLEKYEERHGGS